MINGLIFSIFVLFPFLGSGQPFSVEFNGGASYVDQHGLTGSYGGCLRLDISPEWVLGMNYHRWETTDQRLNNGIDQNSYYFGNNGVNIQVYNHFKFTRNTGMLAGGGLGIYELIKTGDTARKHSILQPAISLSSELYYAPFSRLYFNGQITVSTPVVYRGIVLTHPRWVFLTAGVGIIL